MWYRVCVGVGVCVHVQVCQSSVRVSASQREEWHTNNRTQWPERHGQPDTEFPPKQTWGWAMGEWSDRFRKWSLRQDASAITFPRHWRMRSSNRDQGSTLAALGWIPWVCSWGSLELPQRAFAVASDSGSPPLQWESLRDPRIWAWVSRPPGLSTDTIPSRDSAKNYHCLALPPQP